MRERSAPSLGSGLSALLVLGASARDPDVAPFAAGARIGECLVLVNAEGEVALGYLSPMEREEAAASGLRLLGPDLLDVPRLARDGASPRELLREVVRRALQACAVRPGRVALAGSHRNGLVHEVCGDLERDGWEFVSGHKLLRSFRKFKTAAEVVAVERSAAGVQQALRGVAEMLREAAVEEDGRLWLTGEELTVARLKARVAEILAAHALEQPEGGIVAPAEEGAVPHNSGTPQRCLRAGETLVVDLFPKGDLFADCTRTFVVGEATETVRRAHEAIREALLWAHRETQAGVVGWSLQQGVCDRLQEAGYPTPLSAPGTLEGYVHGLGHGVGFELHELPSFRDTGEDSSGVLAIGDVLTLEPGLYHPGDGYGVRLEDLVVIGEEGPVNLTPLPYELDPRAW